MSLALGDPYTSSLAGGKSVAYREGMGNHGLSPGVSLGTPFPTPRDPCRAPQAGFTQALFLSVSTPSSFLSSLS